LDAGILRVVRDVVFIDYCLYNCLVCRHDICSHEGNLILHATPRFR
jgi:hypothetical protein